MVLPKLKYPLQVAVRKRNDDYLGLIDEVKTTPTDIALTQGYTVPVNEVEILTFFEHHRRVAERLLEAL